MDANAKLDKIRHAIGRAQYFSDLGQTGANYTWQLEQAADAFTVLDAHLRAGGTPPEEWREVRALGESTYGLPDDPCERCGKREVSDDASGLCGACSANNEGRVVL